MIDQEIRQRAEEMFVIDGLTLQEVAGRLGVSERALAGWSSDGEWVRRRREYQRASRDITYYEKMTRLELIKDAMTSLDPQKVYAFARLKKVMKQSGDLDSAIKSRNDGMDGNDGTENTEINFSNMQEAIEALRDAVIIKISGMISNPQTLNVKGIKEAKEMQDMVDDLSARYQTVEDKQGGVSDDLADWIKEKILKG